MCPEFQDDPPPCGVCGSGQHGSLAHPKLEQAFRDFERWVIGFRIRPGVLAGTHGPHSHSDKIGELPDRLRIVRSIISGAGFTDSPVVAPATLRLWKEDPAGGCTFMLSSDRLSDGERESLASLFGDLGSSVTVELKFSRTIPS